MFQAEIMSVLTISIADKLMAGKRTKAVLQALLGKARKASNSITVLKNLDATRTPAKA
jgi:xanthine/uracil/vitamin C permease (AzgA family)